MTSKKSSTRYCIVCGNPLKRGAKTTCGRDCYKISISKEFAECKNSNVKVNVESKVEVVKHRKCAYCGRTIDLTNRKIDDPESLYCNEFCRSQFTLFANKQDVNGAINYTKKNCLKCGTTFSTISNIGDFCCIECSGERFIERKVYRGICAYCGGSFSQHDPNDIFCSNECFIKSKLDSPFIMKKKKCESCNRILVTMDRQDLYNGALLFCEDKCYSDFLEIVAAPYNRKLGLYHAKPINAICESCGKNFLTMKEGVKYCCLICEDHNPAKLYLDDMSYRFDIRGDNDNSTILQAKPWLK